MANMFLDLKDVRGESIDHAYDGKIEVHDWSWGMHNNATFNITGKQAAQHTRFLHLIVDKKIDLSTPTLMRFCAHGWKIDSGTLICRKNDGDTQVDYLKIHLEEIKVQRVDWPQKGADDGAIHEQVELSFHRVSVEYKMQQNDGNLSEKPILGKNEFPLFNIPDPDKTAAD
jgi:type VI secretion system secreted protein Hcp